MASTQLWLKDGRPPPDDVIRIIEALFHRSNRPLYLGAVALYIGWSLDRTQEMVDVLVEHGVLKLASAADKEAWNIRDDGIVYALVGPPVLAKAWR